MTPPPSDVRIRPMRPDDVPEAERLSSLGYYELDTRTFQRGLARPAAARGVPTRRPG